MCVGFLAGFTYLDYPVLMSPKKDETTVHCRDPALLVLVTLIFGNVFDVASALQSISCIELANQKTRHSGYKHMLYNNNNNKNNNTNNNNNLFLLYLRSTERICNPVMEGNRIFLYVSVDTNLVPIWGRMTLSPFSSMRFLQLVAQYCRLSSVTRAYCGL